jgi:superfamily II DNA or RNA helicase
LLPKARIAITTAGLEVMKRIFDELAYHLPNVGITTSKLKRHGERVHCYSAGSLNHCTEPVDLLICDEGHELCSESYLKRFATRPFRYARRWSFSANFDDRGDGADFEFEGFFGPLVAKITYEKSVEKKCVVPIEVHWRDVVMDDDPGASFQKSVSKERHSIWRNKRRNEIIAEDALSFSADEQVLTTVKTIEHGLRLRKLLPGFTFVYSENAFSGEEGEENLDYYISQGLISPDEPPMTWRLRDELRKQFEQRKLLKAIATSVWNRGVDFRGLAALIRADAVSSAIADTQIPGRTSRLCDATGKQVGIIIDYRDQFSKTFRNRANTRRRHYERHGWRRCTTRQKTSGQESISEGCSKNTINGVFI